MPIMNRRKPILRFDIQNAFNKRYIDPLDAAKRCRNPALFQRILKEKAVWMMKRSNVMPTVYATANMAARHAPVLNNYARGRTFAVYHQL